MKRKLKNIVQAHRFFVRESQHYMLGNWYEHAKRDPLKRADVRKFILRWPFAYAKFMSFSILDVLKSA